MFKDTEQCRRDKNKRKNGEKSENLRKRIGKKKMGKEKSERGSIFFIIFFIKLNNIRKNIKN